MSMGAEVVEVSEFLRELWRGGAWAYYWRVSPDGHKETRWFRADTPPAVPAAWAGSHIYMGVHTTARAGRPGTRALKQAATDKPDSPLVARIGCLFCEWDAKDFVQGFDRANVAHVEEGKAAIMAHLEGLWAQGQGLPWPSVLVDSGGGYHGYWMLEEPLALGDDATRAQAIRAQAAWVALWGGDDDAKDIARVLRLPGTLNHKYSPPRPVQIVEADAGRLYPWARLLEWIPEAEASALVHSPATATAQSDDRRAAAYATAALRRELELVQSTAQGGRNGAVNRSAFRLGQLVGGGVMEEAGVVDALTQAGEHSGLTEAEARKAAQNGFAAGRRNPRGLPEAEPAHTNGAGWQVEPTSETSPWLDEEPQNLVAAQRAEDDPEPTPQGLPAAQRADDDPEPPHPLDVEPGEMPHLGWIDDYANHAALRTASPLAFNRVAALTLAAAVIRRCAVLRMSFGAIYPNLYGALIAPSTVYHKTTCLGLAGNLLWRAQLDGLTLPAEFTPEGLLRGLAGQSGGLVRRDEIGRLFASNGREYLRELKPMLTELFDGNTVKKQLSHEQITVANPCLNILGATTPARFYESVGLMDWRDGFLPRWIFALPDGDPDFDAEPTIYSGDDDRRFGELAAVLAGLDRQRDTDFAIDQNAFGLWNAWRRAGVKAAYDYGDDVVQSIIGRNATHALKFALILAAVNGSWGRITAETMQAACALADHFKGVTHKLLMERAQHEVSGERLQKVYKFVHRCNVDGQAASERDIARKFTWRKSHVTPLVEHLCDMGAILQVESGRSVRYVPADAAMQSLPLRRGRK